MKKISSRAQRRNPETEKLFDALDSVDLMRKFGNFGRWLHDVLENLPANLKISKRDAVEMHRTIDESSRLRSLSYWLFIIAACGIATLGLVTNSPAVIIGAMLVSPLMSPIIGLGMGIAINDVYLGVKAIIGILLSFITAVITSSFITLIVPLHEPTAEILNRTNPTMLDLFIALFCGIVASLSSVRSEGHSAMKDVAPGAAIGVALMPPICVVGFGLGSGIHLEMMWGAFLLFLTNLMAIVFISSLFYYFVYHSYNPRRLVRLQDEEREENEKLFTSKFRLVWKQSLEESGTYSFFRKRFWFPIILILLISYPLTSSLVFLKKKNDIRHYILNEMEQNIQDIHIFRGPETLNYTTQGVSGNILYSSGKLPAPGVEAEINKSIKSKFNGYDSKIIFVRIAGTEDINALKVKTVLSLDSSSTTLHDTVRHAYARDIVRRAGQLLQNRFPAEWGVILSVKVGFDLSGMDSVSIHYVGKKMSAETQSAIQMTFRNELRELQGDVESVVLVREGPVSGTVWCKMGNETAENLTVEKISNLLEPLQTNSDLYLNITGNDHFQSATNKLIEEQKLKKVFYTPEQQKGCAIRYVYSYAR